MLTTKVNCTLANNSNKVATPASEIGNQLTNSDILFALRTALTAYLKTASDNRVLLGMLAAEDHFTELEEAKQEKYYTISDYLKENKLQACPEVVRILGTQAAKVARLNQVLIKRENCINLYPISIIQSIISA